MPDVVSPARRVSSSPMYGIGLGFWLLLASSSTIRRRWFSSARAIRSGESAGNWSVGLSSRPPEASVTWPNRPWKKFCWAVRVWGIVTSMPSYRSRSPLTVSGSEISAGSGGVAFPQSISWLRRSISVWFWNSVTRPVRRRSSPTDGVFVPYAGPRKTKTPSDVATSSSPARSRIVNPRRFGNRAVTTPSVVLLGPPANGDAESRTLDLGDRRECPGAGV